MPQLTEAFEVRDDWTGLSDTVERRKAQNRLNQRARRRRNNGHKWTPLKSKIDDVHRGHQKVSNPAICHPLGLLTSKTASQDRPSIAWDYVLHMSAITAGSSNLTRLPSFSVFPLSSDHLIPLVHYNVWRAIATNMTLLGSTHMFECRRRMDHSSQGVPPPMPENIPPSLQPTALQRQIEHEPWIDLFPLPALRDALIRAQGLYDDCDLCFDMVGGFDAKDDKDSYPRSRADTVLPLPLSSCSSSSSSLLPSRTRPSTTVPRQTFSANTDPNENKGLIIWGNPEYIGSWEVSDGFARKWGWMISRGCGDLLRATDSHRRARGDDPISWEVLGIEYS